MKCVRIIGGSNYGGSNYGGCTVFCCLYFVRDDFEYLKDSVLRGK